jgi:hypothetical protein
VKNLRSRPRGSKDGEEISEAAILVQVAVEKPGSRPRSCGAATLVEIAAKKLVPRQRISKRGQENEVAVKQVPAPRSRLKWRQRSSDRGAEAADAATGDRVAFRKFLTR